VVDSHTHLHLCEQDDAQLVEDALERGVRRIVTVGTDGRSSRLALEAAERFPQVHAAIGRHPNGATGFDDGDLAELEALASHERCVAIGETGLDFFREGAAAADQERAFLAQVELARRVGKPLVIHTRSAEEPTLRILHAHAGDLPVVLHCFSMAGRVAECLARPSWVFSFAGNITYPRSSELRAAMLEIPLDRLLVETDAPYLAPQPVRGKPNIPANVTLTAQALATERGISYHELEDALDSTAARVFGWSGSDRTS
jgi:TatD DNase family protein